MSRISRKKRKGPAGKRPIQATKASRSREWVGGRITAPFYLTEPESYRPEMILWLELPEGLVVGSELVDPNEPPVSFPETLHNAMEAPLAGPPRRPARIRVSDARLAAEVREAFPDINVVAAPTPELDRILQHMAETFSGMGDGAGDASYLQDGGISPKTVGALFRAAVMFYRAAPWEAADDMQVLRVDIPALGVAGACISVIGALGENRGFIIFPSIEALDTYLAAVEASSESDGPPDLGTSMVSLSFDRGADLPDSMRREAAEHGWPVFDATAYPTILYLDSNAVPQPPTEDDISVVAVCAAALATFFSKHRDLFERHTIEPVQDIFVDDNGLEVRITAPYDAGHLFNTLNAPVSASQVPTSSAVGRNAPPKSRTPERRKHGRR